MKKYIVVRVKTEIRKNIILESCKYANCLEDFADELEKIIISPESEQEVLCFYDDRERAIKELDFLEGKISNLNSSSGDDGCLNVDFFNVQKVEVDNNKAKSKDDWKCLEEIAKCDWGFSLKEVFDECKSKM